VTSAPPVIKCLVGVLFNPFPFFVLHAHCLLLILKQNRVILRPSLF
jgi:hypothetical protein